jgi:hypothetical protein
VALPRSTADGASSRDKAATDLVRCAACASSDGASFVWNKFEAPGSPHKHGNVVHDSTVTSAGNFKELIIPCLGWATFEGSGMCRTMGCCSDHTDPQPATCDKTALVAVARVRRIDASVPRALQEKVQSLQNRLDEDSRHLDALN